MADVAAPTIDDARTAGRALAGAGAREVLAFGSVARGDAEPYSDIDLVAVLDDVDYRNRWQAKLALDRLASQAAGHSVDVWLTDVPEWAAQNRRAASFAAAIRPDLVPVASSAGDDSAVRWDKEQLMAESDTEAAYRRLREANRQLNRVAGCHRPDARERQAAAAGGEDLHDELRTDRLVQACTAAAMAIETALKALGSDAQIDPRVLHSHNIGDIVDALGPEDRAAARGAVLTGAVRTFDAVSVWRSLGDYYPDPDQPQPDQPATVSFTTAIAAAAATVCEHASDKIARLRGRQPVNDSIAHVVTELRSMARGTDIATGELRPRGPGDDLVPGL